MTDVSEKRLNLDDDERDRGILGSVDRQYVRGEKEYAHRQTAYDRRQTIKNRVRHSLLDLSLLSRELDDELLEDVLGDYRENDQIREGIVDTIALVFRITAIEGVADTLGSGPRNHDFETVLEKGVRRGFFTEDCIVDDFDYSTKTTHIPNLQAVKELAEDGEELSPEFIRMILYEDIIDTDTIQEEVRKQILELPDEGEETS